MYTPGVIHQDIQAFITLSNAINGCLDRAGCAVPVSERRII
jgi:hypothetical protein